MTGISTETGFDTLAEARRRRSDAHLAAHHARTIATHEADLEYSETVADLQAQFQAALAAARLRHRRAVTPAHQAFNRATSAAEAEYADAVRAVTTVEVDMAIAIEIAEFDLVTF